MIHVYIRYFRLTMYRKSKQKSNHYHVIFNQALLNFFNKIRQLNHDQMFVTDIIRSNLFSKQLITDTSRLAYE